MYGLAGVYYVFFITIRCDLCGKGLLAYGGGKYIALYSPKVYYNVVIDRIVKL